MKEPAEEGLRGRLRILLVTQSFHPDVAAVAQHATDLARFLADAGHDVTVITSRSLYGERGAALPAHENIGGVRVLRVGISLFGKAGLKRRSADSLAFIVAASVRMLTLPRADVVVTTSLPPFAGVVGALAKTLRGSAHACWVLDLHPDLAISVGALREESWTARSLTWISSAILRHADLRAVMGRCMRTRLALHGVPIEDLEIIPPWADGAEIRVVPRGEGALREEWGLRGRFVVQYAGNFGLAHDLATILEAAAILREDPRFAFLFVGGGKQAGRLQELVALRGLQSVQVRPHVPRERLSDSLGVGNVHLVALSSPALGVSVPSKLWGILAAGRPAVFVGPEESEIARLIREEDCGIVVPPGDARGLAESLKGLAGNPELAAAMGARARTALEQRHDRRLTCAKWEQRLVAISSSRRGVPARP